MIQFMPANHSNTNGVITILIYSDKTRFKNVFVTLLCRVAKDVTSSLLSWHKHNYLRADPSHSVLGYISFKIEILH